MALMEQKMKAQSHELFGNGQPGRLDKMESKIDEINGKLGKHTLIIGSLCAMVGGGATSIIRYLL